ncbi:MAG: type II toxin-antitoxin system HicB family antitoxin [Chloroflexota bacterium]|nr:type II toxin-antitoxin system HicB family antitoxin [Chloroflexota bacterium]
MVTTTRRPLEDYLALEYPFNVIADPDGGYVIVFPDLPGCLTQAESAEEVGPMAEDARRLWLAAAYAQGQDIALPSYSSEYSGKFNVRLPRSLHQSLAGAAEREEVSLNAYVVMVLARGDAQARVESRLDAFTARLDAIQDHLRYRVTGAPSLTGKQRRLSSFSSHLRTSASPAAESSPAAWAA